tara:strand:- start:179 stop:442 length:264 start_codon:yes stop_codon:yes gene_type:complete
MLSMVASIAAPIVMSKFGKTQKLQQQSLKAPPDINIFEKYRRGIRRTGPKYFSQRSRPASVETGSYGPLSIYNSILKKQLGLLTSKG